MTNKVIKVESPERELRERVKRLERIVEQYRVLINWYPLQIEIGQYFNKYKREDEK